MLFQNLEPRITECSELLLARLQENDQDIERILGKISTDEVTVGQTSTGVGQLSAGPPATDDTNGTCVSHTIFTD